MTYLTIAEAAHDVAFIYHTQLTEHVETPDVTPPPAFDDITFAVSERYALDEAELRAAALPLLSPVERAAVEA
jgi:hypothetical protein